MVNKQTAMEDINNHASSFIAVDTHVDRSLAPLLNYSSMIMMVVILPKLATYCELSQAINRFLIIQ